MKKSKNRKDFCSGWDFAATLAGSNQASGEGKRYVGRLTEQIKIIEDRINNHPYVNNKQFHGYAAEELGAETFNLDAIAGNVPYRAHTLGSTESASVDVTVRNRSKTVADYSFKNYRTASDSAKAQAKYNNETGRASYFGMKRWVPPDQLQEAINTAHREYLRNSEIRPEISEAYAETERELTDVVQYRNTKSLPFNHDEIDAIAKKGKTQSFRAKEFGLEWEKVVTPEYIAKQAAMAGCSAATVSVLLSIAPDALSMLLHLIKKEHISSEEVRTLGVKGFSSGAKGFMHGALACWIKILCEKGAFGAAFVGIDPTLLGTMVSIAMQTVTNTVLLVLGKLTARDFAIAIAESVAVSSAFIIGSKVGQVVDNSLGIKLPIGQFFGGQALALATVGVFKIVRLNKRRNEKESLQENNYESAVLTG